MSAHADSEPVTVPDPMSDNEPSSRSTLFDPEQIAAARAWLAEALADVDLDPELAADVAAMAYDDARHAAGYPGIRAVGIDLAFAAGAVTVSIHEYSDPPDDRRPNHRPSDDRRFDDRRPNHRPLDARRPGALSPDAHPSDPLAGEARHRRVSTSYTLPGPETATDADADAAEQYAATEVAGDVLDAMARAPQLPAAAGGREAAGVLAEGPDLAGFLQSAMRRSQLLLRISEALSRAADDREVSDAVTGLLRRHLGARFTGIALVEPDAEFMRYVSLDPLPGQTVADWTRFPVSTPVPVAAAVVRRRAYFHGTLAAGEADFPGMAELLRTSHTAGDVNVPLVVADRAIGALTVSWADEHECDADERALLLVVAGYTAQALARTADVHTPAPLAAPAEAPGPELRAPVAGPGGSAAADRAAAWRSTDGVMYTATDGTVFAANPAACAILRRNEADICAVGRWALADPADHDRWLAAAAQRAATGAFRGELSMLRGDGRSVPVELVSSPFVDDHGQQRSCVVFRDISERVEAARAALQTAAGRAQAEERHRIAERVHASVIQTLFAAAFGLETRPADARTVDARTADASIALVQGAIAELRELVADDQPLQRRDPAVPFGTGSGRRGGV